MVDNHTYCERVSSNRTEALFLMLTLFFLSLFIWRLYAVGFDIITAVLFCLFGFFLFYSLNYRTLIIRLTPEFVELRFGLFTWTIALENIEECFLDDTSIWRIGGAGIHFSPIHGRYRAMLNFLEYPRVVVALKRKKGPVRDIVFSTHRPDAVLQFIQAAASAKSAA